MTSSLASLSKAVSDLAADFDEFQNPEEEVDLRIRNAQRKVFDEWIDSVANYNPYNRG